MATPKNADSIISNSSVPSQKLVIKKYRTFYHGDFSSFQLYFATYTKTSRSLAFGEAEKHSGLTYTFSHIVLYMQELSKVCGDVYCEKFLQ